MKSIVIYIHGFASGPGLKADILEKAFPNSEIVAPQLIGHVEEDLVTLKKLVFQYSKHNSQIHIVGTSLGGFYALCIAASNLVEFHMGTEPKFYIINPSFSPHETLLKYKDQEVPNYKSGPGVTLIDFDFDALKSNKEYMMKNFKGGIDLNVFIGTEDEVLEFDEFLEFLETVPGLMTNIHYSQQDHRFADIDNVIKSLRLNRVS
jgi:predicted esterase YcpF (UPF0227 family)